MRIQLVYKEGEINGYKTQFKFEFDILRAVEISFTAPRDYFSIE